MSLPTGTVTFLFTDIEGSTRLWEEHPDAMRTALLQHDDLLRACIESNGGRVFKTVGDAFCAAFPEPRPAVDTVLAAQQWLPALALDTPGGPQPLKVRMALHTGIVEERDGDYFGQPLNRLARLLAIGHGGQVLLSEVTQGLCREALPRGCSLVPLGEHRLKDLGRPETLFQLCHPDLPAEFPPLRSLDNPELQHNLPQQVTSFIGREKELAEVKALLGAGGMEEWKSGRAEPLGTVRSSTRPLVHSSTRLVTLTGAGGSGKTRLALQVAADLVGSRAGAGAHFSGCWLVELAALADPSLVPEAAASALGLKEEAGKSLTQTVVEYLKPKHLLLVLDNCEHLLEACARLADALLRHCPQVLILATSREGLGIAGETTYRVPSLSVPDPKQPQTPESLFPYEAVRLFIERATQVQPRFAVTHQNAPALASICRQLDGIPLALELAAARVRALSVEEVNQKLDQRFRLLTGGSRMALPRQRTLRSLIDWSYDLLNESEQALLRRLSVFAGGWALEAAEAVCADEEWKNGGAEEWKTPDRSGSSTLPLVHSSIHAAEILDLLASLVDKSLVTTEERLGATRYRLLETVRQYARDRLVESGEAETWRDRHLAHFLPFAEEAQRQLTGAGEQTWLDRLETEHDNLRAALEWALKDEGGRMKDEFGPSPDIHPSSFRLHPSGEAGLRLCGAMSSFWVARGYYGEGQEWCRSALERANQGAKTTAYARALDRAGILAMNVGDYPSAASLLEVGLAVYRDLNEWRGIAQALNGLGIVAREQGEYDAARAFHEESLSIRRQHGEPMGISQALFNLGRVALVQGDYDSARSLLEESLSIRRQMGWRRGFAMPLAFLGEVAFEQGNYAAARSLLEESLFIRRELADRSGIAESLNLLGTVANEQGDLIAARSLYEESLSIRRELRLRNDIAMSLESFADLAAAQAETVRAARLWGAAELLREEIGCRVPLGAQTRHNTRVAAARTLLGDDASFDAAWAEGRAMPLEQAIELARGGERWLIGLPAP